MLLYITIKMDDQVLITFVGFFIFFFEWVFRDLAVQILCFCCARVEWLLRTNKNAKPTAKCYFSASFLFVFLRTEKEERQTEICGCGTLYCALETHLKLRIQSKAVVKCVSLSACQNTHFGIWTLRILLYGFSVSSHIEQRPVPHQTNWIQSNRPTNIEKKSNQTIDFGLKCFRSKSTLMYGLGRGHVRWKSLRYFNVFRVWTNAERRQKLVTEAIEKKNGNEIRGTNAGRPLEFGKD